MCIRDRGLTEDEMTAWIDTFQKALEASEGAALFDWDRTREGQGGFVVYTMLKLYFSETVDQRQKAAALRSVRHALSSNEKLRNQGREPYAVLEPPPSRKPLRAAAARFFSALQRRGVDTKAR
eukprot:5426064-Lingulodinium_polyedra.AAC.1